MIGIASVFQEEGTPSVMITPEMRKNWWSLEVLDLNAFENPNYVLDVYDPDNPELPGSAVADCSKPSPGVFAFGERAWRLLPSLKASGCRIAERAVTSDGRAFKLVYPGAVVDILDHAQSTFSLDDPTPDTTVYGSINWAVLYETNQNLPLLFRVFIRHPGIYRGVSESPSIEVFATDTFVEMYRDLCLTGLEFIPRERSKRPQAEPANIVVYSPSQSSRP